jgi:predicted RNA binding protein with dsRBD fold (UPF0201 family)
MPTRVLVRAEVNSTEDETKVKAAVSNLTGSSVFAKANEGKRIILTQEGDRQLLVSLRGMLRRERILDAARKMMLRGIDKDTVTFCMNKQVALAGHISFCRPSGESPMGPITFCISDDDPYSLIEWLATRTVDGVPVD